MAWRSDIQTSEECLILKFMLVMQHFLALQKQGVVLIGQNSSWENVIEGVSLDSILGGTSIISNMHQWFIWRS